MEVDMGFHITQKSCDSSSSTFNFRFANDGLPTVHWSRETTTTFLLVIHLRGFRKQDIDIQINEEGNRILVVAERPVHKLVLEQLVTLRKKARLITVKKVFCIPDIVDLERIAARFIEEDKTLTISMPKRTTGMLGVEIVEDVNVKASGLVEKTSDKKGEKTLVDRGTMTEPHDIFLVDRGNMTETVEAELRDRGTKTEIAQKEFTSQGTMTQAHEPKEYGDRGTMTDIAPVRLMDRGMSTEIESWRSVDRGTMTEVDEKMLKDQATMTDIESRELLDHATMTESEEKLVKDQSTMTDTMPKWEFKETLEAQKEIKPKGKAEAEPEQDNNRSCQAMKNDNRQRKDEVESEEEWEIEVLEIHRSSESTLSQLPLVAGSAVFISLIVLVIELIRSTKGR